MSKRFWEIKDIDGNGLYSGNTVTRKELFAEVAAFGGTFARADLKGFDLSHLDLDGLDFTGADLTGAKMRGSTANKAKFDYAILDGVRGEGMTAKEASFRHARFKPCLVRNVKTSPGFDGAILTHSRFDGAQMEHTSFEGCSMAGISMALAKVRRCNFSSSIQSNAEYSRAELYHNNFKSAELTATTSATRIPRASLPDRTTETIAIGNDYTGAVLDDTTAAFRWDRVFGKVAGQVAWGVSAAAMLVATSFLPLDVGGEWLGKYIGQGVTVVGLVGLSNMLLEKVGDRVKNKISDGVLKLQLAIRETTLDIRRRGGNVRETVVAMAYGAGIGPIRRALAATSSQVTESGIRPLVKAITAGSTNIIVCNRSHMAAALEWISASYGHTRLLDKDLVVSRIGEGDEAPSIMKFFAGGGMAAFWTKDGEVNRALAWSADSMEVDGWPRDNIADFGMKPAEVRRLFEIHMVKDHMPHVDLSYNALTETIRAGMDGSIVVVESRNQLARNKNGPVLIRPDGSQYSERHAKMLVHLENRNDDDDDIAPIQAAATM